MFRERGVNTFPGNGDLGGENADRPRKATKTPMLRTLEPRMVFDAAADVATQHALAPAHPEPAVDAGHPSIVEPAWNHLAEALKAAPVTPVDKSADANGPAPITPVAAHPAVANKAIDTVAKLPPLNTIIDDAIKQASTAAGDKIAEQGELAKTAELHEEEIHGAIEAAVQKALAVANGEVVRATERLASVPPTSNHGLESLSSNPIAPAERAIDNLAAIDPKGAPSQWDDAGFAVLGASADRQEVSPAHALTEHLAKVEPAPDHAATSGKVQPTATVEATTDRPSETAKPDTHAEPTTENHLPVAADRVVTDPRASDTKSADVTVAAGATETASQEVYFVWDNVKDWQQIVASLGSSARVYVLDSTKDGVEQIAAILKGERNISAIHLISHGSEGSLSLGTAVLDAASMQGQYRDELTTIGQALSQDGDILIYGCDFAAGDDGLQAAVILGGITHADIAASTDATGAAALGGDWDLERQTGTIETAVLTDYAYQSLLAAPAIDLDGAAGSTGSFTAGYTENSAPVPIVADGALGATVTDSDNDIQSIAITADAAPNGNAEHLTIGGQIVGLGSDFTGTVVVGATTFNVVYTAATRTFTITNASGGAIPSGGDTNTLIRSITYDNTSDDPTNGGASTSRVFTFTATDATAVTSAASTATVAITAVNDAPVAANDTNTIAEDTVATGNVLANDTDVDGALTVTQFVAGGTTHPAGETATLAGVGTLVINADGSYTFTPEANYNGPVPVATYTVSDGSLTATATLTLDVTPVNDAPVDGDETNTVSEDTTLTVADGAAGDLLNNATDIDGGPLTISGFAVAGQAGPFVVGTGYLIAGVGTITINANGSYSFAPAANFVGTIPLITYTVSDGAGGTDTSTLALTMVGANDAPAGTNNTLTISEDTSYTFTAASFGFTDPNDTPANAFQAVIITTLPSPSEGTLLLNGNAVTVGQTIAVADIPNLTFQPAADVNGTGVGAFTFQVVDNGGTANGGQDTDQSPNTFAFNITAVNDLPVATDDTVTTPEDTTLTGNVLANDTDVDGDTLTITSFSALNVTAIPGQTGTIPGVGQITMNADGSYTFVPVANFTGPVPVITYTISDGHGGTDTATLNITVISVNDPPVDGNETNTVIEDTTLTVADGGSGDLLNNSSDLDGDPLTITDYTIPGVNGGNPIAAGTATLIPNVGTITINANGSYSFVPVANYDGPIPVISYTVSDGTDTDTSTLTLTMTPVNDAPIAVDDAATTPENTAVSGNVLGNDTDVDDPTLTVTFFTINGTTYGAGTAAPIPGVGTMQINTDGSYTFTPAPNYDGPVPPVTYTVSDGELTDTAILTITITPENQPPVAGDDTGTTLEDTTLSVPASSGLLTNDTDVDGDPLTITEFTVAGDPTVYSAGDTATIAGVGNLTINADGSYTFVPAPNYNGPVPVATYTVSDDSGATDQATLTLDVTPVNDPPVTIDDTGTTPEDTPLSGSVLTNDSDPDAGDTLTVVGFSVNGNTFFAGSTATLPQGTITINADGTYTLVPAANYTGPVPVITYVVVDENGATSTATLTLNVTPVNDPPVANDDNATTQQDTPVNGNVLANDTDVDGDALTVTGFVVDGTTYGPGETANIPGVGNLTLNANGSYTFVPEPGYTGPVPDVTYTVSDGTTSDDGTLTIDVIPPNEVGANNDVATTPEDITLNGNVLANDVGPDSAPISVVDFQVAGDPTVYTPGSTATVAGVGALTINLDGSYTFVPAPNYFGPVPVVTYTATNGTVSDTATLIITVTPVNDPPVAVDDTGVTPEDTPLSGNVLSNDTDIDSALTVTGFSIGNINFNAGQTAPIPNVGQLTINASGSYTFVPAANYNGPVPVATYTVSDGNGGTDTGTLTITVTPVNDAPAAVNDTGTTQEDTTLNGNVLTNDTDVEGATLTVSGFEVAGTTYTAGQTATITGVGQLTINANGGYTFVPALNYNGPVPVATYTVSDGTSTATATLTINVTPVNDAPIANDDTATLAEDTTLTVPAASGLLANDTDVENASLTVEGFEVDGVLFGAGTTATIPGVGQLTINANGSYTFTPVANFNGTVPPVTYRISDGSDGTDTAVLTITVTPVNDAPIDGNETNTVVEDTTLTVTDGAAGDLLNNATDIDGIDTLTITDYSIPGVNGGNSIAAGTATLIPGVGTVTINSNGSYTFTPVADYTGPIPVITYTVSDNAGGTDTSTLTLSITPVNDPPIAVNDIVSTPEDTTLTGNVLGNDVDVDGDTLRVTLYSVNGLGGFLPGAPAVIPNVGTLTINADGSYTFVPVANYNGPVPFATYTIADASGIQDTADLIIVVTPVNDPPVDGDETNTVTEDTTLTVPAAGGLLANATDIDGGPLSITGYTVAGINGTVGSAVAIAGVGAITINADGSYTFVPEPNYTGPIPLITYTVSDGAGGSDTSTLTLTMVPVNDPPVDGDETNTVIEDTTLTVPAGGGLLVNASDIDGGALTISGFTIAGVTGTQQIGSPVPITGVGTITINADGSYSFAPAANYTGPIPVITYTVSDGAGGTDTSTLTLTITPVNDAPVDGDEANSVTEDTTLTVADGATGDLLNNAVDVEGNPLTITGYTIAGVIGPRPVGTPVAITGVGTITINANGSYSFIPVANYAGAIPVITYTVSDGNGGTDTSTLTLTITPVNDAPAGTDHRATISEDTAYTFAAADFGFTDSNDSPANALQAVIITTLPPAAEGTLLLSGVPVTTGQVITLAQIPDLTFQPAANVAGLGIGAFTFQVVDNGGTANGGQDTDQSPNTFAFNIAPVNDPPVDGNETNAVIEDTTLTVPAGGGLLVNASDIDGDPLTITGYTIAGITGTQPVGSPVIIAGVGTMTINADGSYSFAPAANYTGPIPVITYTVSDGRGGSDTSTLTLTMTPVNDPPVDGDETNSVTEDTTLTVTDGSTGDLLNNASDVEGDPLSITGYTIAGIAGNQSLGTPVLIDGVGTITINADGSYSFVPVANYAGPIPVITYTVSDGNGGTDTSTLTLTMIPVNDPPVASDDTGTTPEDTTLTGNVLTNDTDIDGGPLRVTQFVVGGTTYTAGQTASIANVGLLTINALGTYSFVPALNYNGPVPTASYTISDGNGGTDTATLSITITPVNDPPGPDPDRGALPPQSSVDGRVVVPVLVAEHFADVDGDVLTYSARGLPPGLSINPVTGIISGRLPNDASQASPYIVVVTATDPSGLSAREIFVWTVINPVPVANDDVGTTAEDTVLTGTVITNDSDPDGDAISVAQFTIGGTTYAAGQTANLAGVGSLVINADGSYTFTPALNFNGVVPIATYTLRDNDGGTDTATLALVVTPVDDVPILVDDHASGNEDTTITGNVLTNDSDPDGDTLFVTGFTVNGDPTSYLPGETVTIPGVGTISLQSNGDFTFIPAPNFDGPVPDILYNASDGNGGTGQAKLVITITPVDDFVPVPDQNEPNLPVGLDYGFEPITADGAVLDAVDELGSLNGIDHFADRPIDAPVRYALEPFLGGSSTIIVDLPRGGEEKIHVEAIKHSGVLYLQIIDEKADGGETSVLNYRLRAQDGSPVPVWLRQVGPMTFAGYPDANTGTLDLILSVVRRDGQVSDYRLQLDTVSGHLSRPPAPENHGFEGRLAPTFAQQMNERPLNQNIELLERALGFL
ncbi:CshA-type fibril repeat-containing protein [Phyllobacterium sp. CL33Tsu]|uniref:Ig-like domain-containing protein n=1 Tax=Phyllobacterium sp. CL33Tsu TaxID=1798191 RepID=UPI0008E3020D|nr:Ig-like domain-containing protein [Phyllobacterium sp. CL33Tsu]SFJ17310.1 CshA-type fibril repeat-containing protein [Phyllobacterium sp. CL33Tsu]